ncbi:class I SAM-dependent methyltransferase [Microvirga pudoricolor]|uniref:class I SAM-dependent methyltransferase n=1 Tax=Microvirga pudoricolor TaxID=2778729 RepID=UPI0019509852|nr:class I SAM-dependent methyltransferase [Microvirga pudoricolor]MBM6594774.1 class I SAM-dependent methyltransferase [Microvirga pudoricolor]
MSAFDDPEAVARYAENPPRLVPGFAALQRMALVLIAERAPEDARILVLGAGGGLELKAFADAQARWHFDGIDPSAEMLKLAEKTLGPHALRVCLHQGLVDVAPEGPYDAATCLLTLHFMPAQERLRALREIRRRLKPGAPFVAAHHSISLDPEERRQWLSRFAAFAEASGVEPERARQAGTGIGEGLPILTPAHDEALLREAGFRDVSLFYAAFTFRGWVAYG